MTVTKEGCPAVCSVPFGRSDNMEAHQQCRKADRLLAAGKFKEAISCHGKAAELLTEAMKTADCEQVRLSLELQRDGHIKQQRLIQERWKREARREATKARLSELKPTIEPVRLPKTESTGQPSRPLTTSACGGIVEREYDTLLYQLQTRQAGGQVLTPVCPGSKTAKDDKTRLEEQQTTIEDLRCLVDRLTIENEWLKAENKRLLMENARLQSEAADFVERSELWVLTQAAGGQVKKSTGKGKEIAIPHLPPLEMPAQEDLCLDNFREDIQNEIQEMLDKEKL
ncbi:nuclear receptor-binding factor 2b isoform 2-T2 [Pholidichthys leucotaenia]